MQHISPFPTAWPQPAFLPLSAPHQMAYRVVGNQAGSPWLLLHGGPGASGNASMLRPLDLQRHWAVIPDQRGAGLSRPRGRTTCNTTAGLVADLEKLRETLGIKRWSILGGSWGTVVALMYAKRHSQQVDRMVLRGAFGVTRRELAGLLQPGQRARGLLGNDLEWPCAPGYGVPSILKTLNKLIHCGTPSAPSLRAVRRWNMLEMACAWQGLHRSLLHVDHENNVPLAREIRRDVAALHRSLRRAAARLTHPRAEPRDRQLRDKFRVQGHYLAKRGFVRPGELDSAVRVAAVAGIPIDWVHGQFDAVCPASNSQKWASAMLEQFTDVRLHIARAGHLGNEADTLAVLRAVVRGKTGGPK